MLLSEYDSVRVYYEYKEALKAPVYANELVGHIYVTVNDEIVDIIEIRTMEDAPKDTFIRYIEDVIKIFLF